VRRWDLVLANLDPRKGMEQGGRRPVLVISNSGFNRQFPLLTVLPLTSLEGKRRRVYGFEVLLPAGIAGNSVDSIVMPQQIRTLAQSRVTRIMGSLQHADIQEDIEERLLEHLGVGFDDDLSP
jgi:mRNA interferase MazF